MFLKDSIKLEDPTLDFFAESFELLDEVFLFKVLSALVTLSWRLLTCSGNFRSSVKCFLEMVTTSSCAGPVVSFFFLLGAFLVAEVETVAVPACRPH